MEVKGKAGNIIELTEQLVLNQEPNSATQRPPSIRMVPSAFRDSNAKFFTPRIVSIGPLHRDDGKLQEFEGQKAAFVHDLLLRCVDSPPQQTFDACLQKVKGSIDEIKACYAKMETYSDVDLAKMMVIDGCFILDFLHRLNKELLANSLVTQYIIYDLILVENQIPFFVLENIFQCTIVKFEPTASLTKLMGKLFPFYCFIEEDVVKNSSANTKPDHFLGLVHKSYQPDDSPSNIEYYGWEKGHPATDLDRAGVNFQPNHDQNWLLAMELTLPRFSWFPWVYGKPLLKMPVLVLHDFSELVLRNLIMYEQFSLLDNYVLGYMYFMDMMIDTPEDVRRLKKSKVLVNVLGSDEMAVKMINNIGKEIPANCFFYKNECEKLDRHYNAYWPNITAELKRKYLTSPWTIIALLAAIVLFVLTMVQTIYTVKSAQSKKQ